jgi:ubiquinol-cytochrome c reductase cytochrome b subunit
MHHDAQRPREAPVRAGIGAGGIAFFVLLMLAGSNDVLAKYLQVEVDTLNGVLRVLLFVVPVLVAVTTWWICRDLRAHGGAPIARPARVEFRRNAEGGFDEVHDDTEAR